MLDDLGIVITPLDLAKQYSKGKFANPLVRIINSDPDVVILAEKCLKIVAFVQPVQVVTWVLAGALRGAGDTKWPFYATMIGNWLVRALGSLLCIYVFGMGLAEAVICMCLDQVVRAALMIMRFRSGKWQHVIRDQKASA